jgi:hypothetical protein
MSTDFDWATLVLEDGGWPTSSNNVTVITQWMASENCIPTRSGCSSPWWNRNNPLNNGLGSGGGDGTGSYSNLVIAAYYVALNLEASNYGYPQIADDLAASEAPSVTATAIEDSDWAESHYGYGSGWHSSAVESIAAPASAWGSGGGSPPSEGSFVSYQGNVYRIAGGAALYIGNCAPIPGGCTNVTPVSSLSQFSPTVANGTVLVELDHDGGGYWRAAGGHILPVTSCSGADESVCAGPSVVLPYETIENYDAAHPTVSNGTVIFDLDYQGGGYFRAAGGHILPLTSCGGADEPVCQGDTVQLPYATIQLYDAEDPTVEDGTVIFDLDYNGGGYFRAAGGHILPLTSCSGADESVCQGDTVQLPYDTIENYDAEHPTVENGTVIFDLDYQGGGYFRAAGGHIMPLTSCSGADESVCQGDTVELPYDTIENYDSAHPTIANGTVLYDLDYNGGGYFIVEDGAIEPITTCAGANASLCGGPSVQLPYATIENYAVAHPRPASTTGGSNQTSGTPQTATSTASPGAAPAISTPHGDVDASKSTVSPPRLTSKQLLIKALAACRGISSTKKRAACQSAARRRYQHELKVARWRRLNRALAACKDIGGQSKQRECVSKAEHRYG